VKPRICQHQFNDGRLDSHGQPSTCCERLGRPHWLPWGDIQWLCFDHCFGLKPLTKDDVAVLEVMES